MIGRIFVRLALTFAFRNLATWDRILRLVCGAAALAAGFYGLLPGLGSMALVLFGWVPVITGLLGWCPLYSLLRFSTFKRQRNRRLRL